MSVGETFVTVFCTGELKGRRGDHGRATCDRGACEEGLDGGVSCCRGIGVTVGLVSLQGRKGMAAARSCTRGEADKGASAPGCLRIRSN